MKTTRKENKMFKIKSKKENKKINVNSSKRFGGNTEAVNVEIGNEIDENSTDGLGYLIVKDKRETAKMVIFTVKSEDGKIFEIRRRKDSFINIT